MKIEQIKQMLPLYASITCGTRKSGTGHLVEVKDLINILDKILDYEDTREQNIIMLLEYLIGD